MATAIHRAGKVLYLVLPFAVLSVLRLSAKGACRPFVSPSLSRWGKAPWKNTPRNNISKHIFPIPIFFKGNTLNPIQKTPIFARSLSHNEQSLTQRKPPIPFGGFLFFHQAPAVLQAIYHLLPRLITDFAITRNSNASFSVATHGRDVRIPKTRIIKIAAEIPSRHVTARYFMQLLLCFQSRHRV